jgi:hypothetical protein
VSFSPEDERRLAFLSSRPTLTDGIRERIFREFMAAHTFEVDIVGARRALAELQATPADVLIIDQRVGERADWQLQALAMTRSQVVLAARVAAQEVPEAAKALNEFEAELPLDGPLYEWLSELAPLARSKLFLIVMHALWALLDQCYAEAGEQPPYHIGVVVLILLAIADVWAYKDGLED